MCVIFPGLSIDFEKEQLYWISSGNSTINRCEMDGSKLEVLDGVKGKLYKATALAIMGEEERLPTAVVKTFLWRLSEDIFMMRIYPPQYPTQMMDWFP